MPDRCIEIPSYIRRIGSRVWRRVAVEAETDPNRCEDCCGGTPRILNVGMGSMMCFRGGMEGAIGSQGGGRAIEHVKAGFLNRVVWGFSCFNEMLGTSI